MIKDNLSKVWLKLGVNRLLALLLTTLLVAVVTPANAYNMGWSNNKYTHFSKEEPLREMLKAMANDQNIPIVVSGRIKDTISVYYREKPAKEILNDLIHTFGLATYFDGSILYVYKKDEIKQSMVALKKSPVTSLEYELINMGALDKKDKNITWLLSRESNSVVFRGPRRFVEIVNSVASKLDDNFNVNIYKWRSEDGMVNYSNDPPFNAKYKKVMTIRKPKAMVNDARLTTQVATNQTTENQKTISQKTNRKKMEVAQ